MGYYFPLQHANMLANLINGDINNLFYQIDNNSEDRDMFLKLISDLDENLISTNPEKYKRLTSKIIENMHDNYGSHSDNFVNYTNSSENYDAIRNNVFSESVKKLSKELKSFDYKFLILKNIGQRDNLLEEIVHNDEHNFTGLFMQPKDDMNDDTFTLMNSFKHFDKAMRNIDRWPAVLVWKNSKKAYIIKLKSTRNLKDITRSISRYGVIALENMEIEDGKEEVNYIFHISDLHIGAQSNSKRLDRLKKIMMNKLNSFEDHANVDTVITGDSVDSPKEINFKNFKSYLNRIAYMIGSKPIVVHGNHDVSSRGITLNPSFKSKISYINSMGGRNIVELSNNIILIPLDSNSGGFIAKGKIGDDQFLDFERLIKEQKESRQIKIALLHHHISDIPHPDWRRKEWFERLFPKWSENSLKLIDSMQFINWAEHNGIDLVLHGHKHIPFFDDKTIRNSIILSCGSSTGKVEHVNKDKTYISYNLLKITKSTITINQYVEDVLDSGPTSILTKLIKI